MKQLGALPSSLRSPLTKKAFHAFAICGLSSLFLMTFGCEGGGGTFVGQERDPLSGIECNLCLPAIDPTPVDCEWAEQGVEFLPATIWDFNASNASNLYAYTDDSAEYWNLSGGWQPATEETERCRGQGVTGAFHVKGGPFLNWGGGIGRHLKCLNGSPTTGQAKLGDRLDGVDRACDSVGGAAPILACTSFSQVDADGNLPMDEQSVLARTACPKRDQAVIMDGSDVARSAAPPEEEFLLGMTLDLTEWDGISFWARRSSNDAQAGFRVALGDKHTDDDLSYLQYHINPSDERYCERNVECGCPGNGPCTERVASNGEIVAACWDAPQRLDGQGALDGVIVDGALRCGDQMCGLLAATYPPMQAPDMQIAGATCNPFVFRGGFEDRFCYDTENGQRPVERTHMCGDHWVHPVRLSTEWQFYKVPFGVLLQEGWAKESHKLDLTSAAVVRFTWGPGWPDFWVDDVRFYRNLHNTSGGR